MRFFFVFPLIVAFSSVRAAEPVTRTFYVSGIECGSCVYMVQQSVAETKGVQDVTVIQIIDGYANVTFDPAVVSDQQIAQAVREAYPLHGMPYLATLKLSVTDYAAKAAKVEALFAAWKDALKLEVIDKAKGEVLVHFLPLEADKKKAGPQGWRFTQLVEAAKKEGVEFKLEREGE
ncbi:MAG: heavy-metal-associated domain-containing protein [Prosthecobacter sp.]|jgi:copper chaperone CopZ|uniref:heavy-metal-associated domain-containing protein n=1 Tax=Prosthecobacter sp. TaxID=1965333 RepID=UPI001A07DB4A|nr:heavy-metal-associated domain-containing protein [Prosthecobacter sp.]MBE2287298.1 heavy-metal-associated domain-containing protein [Prosthecobacter sp.]